MVTGRPIPYLPASKESEVRAGPGVLHNSRENHSPCILQEFYFLELCHIVVLARTFSSCNLLIEIPVTRSRDSQTDDGGGVEG